MSSAIEFYYNIAKVNIQAKYYTRFNNYKAHHILDAPRFAKITLKSVCVVGYQPKNDKYLEAKKLCA